jgi:hypothetical protein
VRGWLHAAHAAAGRFVAFDSEANDLVAGDTNRCSDVFVRDRLKRTTERVSVNSSGAQASGSNCASSGARAISADGRFVAFVSGASNLVAGDECLYAGGYFDCADAFVRDRAKRTTLRVSISSSGQHANDDSTDVQISADGRFVAFVSRASNLVVGDTNECIYAGGHYNCADVFVRDRTTGTTALVSVGQ